MKSAVLAAVVLAGVVAGTPARAQHAHAAHEHGVAELRVVAEGEALVVEFASPLDNLVGFEHAPRTPAERKAMADAEAALRNGAGLLQPSAAANCRLKDVALDSPWLQGKRHDHGHDHAHAHAEPASDGHAELVAGYRFECARPAALESLRIGLFDAFPRLRELRAERATARGQGAAVLKAGQAELPL